MADAIEQIFDNMNRWRHLPNYQLERRLDIFLTPYLHRILEPTLGELDDVIVPEMPLKQAETNLSDKINYVTFSRDRRTAYLIELKTDCASLRTEQFLYTERCCGSDWAQTLNGLKQIAQATQQRRKYFHLFRILERTGQLQLAPELFECFRNEGSARWESNFVRVTTAVERVQAIFIVPAPISGRTCITFDEVVARLDGLADPIATALRKHLKLWKCPAGSTSP